MTDPNGPPTPQTLAALQRVARIAGMRAGQPRTQAQASRRLQQLLQVAPASAIDHTADREDYRERTRGHDPRPADDRPATPAMKKLLRDLCAERGLTYVEPHDFDSARARIDELLGRTPRTDEPRALPTYQVPSALPASSFADEEIVGYGASARFA